MSKTYLLSISLLTSFALQGQHTVDILESTIKIPAFGEETFFFGFDEGDQVVLSFNEINKKDLKELEVMEWPSSVKFSEFKVDKVSKTIEVLRKGVYRFRFTNTAISGRICKIRIQRIPRSNSTVGFDSNVYWTIVNDTSFTPMEERYLDKSDTSIINIVEQTSKISSQTALNGNPNLSIVDFELPTGTIAWSYYLGVGKEGQAAYDNARDKFMNTAAKQVSKLEGYGTMAALAIYGLNLFAKVQGENNVKYWIIRDWNSVQLFQSRQAFYCLKQGDVINEASQMTAPLNGKVYFGLVNDNVMIPIDVLIRVTAVKVVQTWGTRQTQKIKVTQRKEAYLK
jgi:hypothetical protein